MSGKSFDLLKSQSYAAKWIAHELKTLPAQVFFGSAQSERANSSLADELIGHEEKERYNDNTILIKFDKILSQAEYICPFILAAKVKSKISKKPSWLKITHENENGAKPIQSQFIYAVKLF